MGIRKDNYVEYTARYVARGFQQINGVDYNTGETFSPTLKMQSIKIVLSIAANRDLEIHQMDVKTAFLNAHLNENVYIEQPEGYRESGRNGERLIWSLNKALYGLKQSARAWYDTAHKILVARLGFVRINSEHGLYVYDNKVAGVYCLLPLYADDMLIACNNMNYLKKLKKTINNIWKVKDMNEVSTILGLTIQRDRTNKTIYLHQKNYIDKIVGYCFYDINDRMCPNDDSERNKMNQIPYRKVVGALIYLTHTRPDITYAVQQICKYMHNPGRAHWSAVRRIVKYIKQTRHYKLTIDGHQPLVLVLVSRQFVSAMVM